MRGLFLNSLCVLLLALPVFGADVSYTVPVDNMLMAYFDAYLSNQDNNYGASTTCRIGDDNDFLDAGDNHTWWHFTGIAEAMAGTIDSIVCSLYVSQKNGTPFDVYVHRLDSTKPTPEGGGNGSIVDCGSSWLRYEEGFGGDALCTDRNWTTGGGDMYAVFDTITVPDATGWFVFRFTSTGNSQVVDYYQNIIDSSTDADTTLGGGAEAAVGGLIFITDNTDNDHFTFHSDDGTNTPRIVFWGNDIVPMRNVFHTKRTHQKIDGQKASMITHDWPDYSKKVHDSTDWTP